MKKRIYLFTFVFLLFNLLVVVVKELPGLAHGKFSMLQNAHSMAEWIQFFGDCLLQYLFAFGLYLLLCVYHPQKKYALLFALLLGLFVIAFFAGLFWTKTFNENSLRISRYFRLIIIPLSGQAFFATVFYLIRYAQFKELQQVELKLQNRQTELSFLRSQINPHFLFNNLNNIYALVAEQNVQALPAIAGLSDLLRYMLYDSSEMVALSAELDHIEKYIALQQLRFEQPTLIAKKQIGNTDTIDISPLLLIPFIENAFKHGQANSNEVWLKWEVNTDAKAINFSCANLIGIKKKDAGGGIGLENVKQRLNLLYPNRHLLKTDIDNNWFIVQLHLQHG